MIAEMHAAWTEKYAEYKDAIRRTHAVINEMQALYQTYGKAIHDLQQSVKNNIDVKLTGADHAALAIHLDKTTRTAVPRQEVAPNIEQVEIKPSLNIFQTAYPDSAGNSHRRLPAYNQLLIKVAYGDGDAVPADAAFTHVTLSGKSKFSVHSPHDIAPVGTRGYVKCAYVNSRGEAGPDSAVFAFVVN